MKPQSQSTIIYDVREPFSKGAPVKVSAPRTEGKKGLRFTYLRHAHHALSGKEWIDVLDKHDKIVSFHLDEVVLIPPKRAYRRKKL